MTLGGVQEPYTPSMNNTSFIAGARSFDPVFEGTVTATFLTPSFSDKFPLKLLDRNKLFVIKYEVFFHGRKS
jgi:hypothetical protein